MEERPFDFLTDPPREASPFPMWFWNDRIEPDGIRSQLREFRAKEIFGFVLHPRMGLPADIPYLSDRFLDLVEVALEEAEQSGMQVILYDEGMYPSGSAHGEVVRSDPSLAAQSLVLRVRRAAPDVVRLDGRTELPSRGEGRLVSRQLLAVDREDGRLRFARILPSPDPASGAPPTLPEPPLGHVLADFVQEPSGGTIRGVHPGEDAREPGAPMAADLLAPRAVETFLRLTHDRYYARLSRFFGTAAVAMFTDEPSLLGRGDMDGRIPWTSGFLDDCLRGGLREEDLAALFDPHPGTAGLRRRFARVGRDRLTETYFRPLSTWCAAHGIALTGHPAEPDALSPQRAFGIPGQDLVLRRVAPEGGKALEGPESTSAKGVADFARHHGLSGSLVECFGCCVRSNPGTGWDLPLEDVKWYVDWLSVRGVDRLVPHAFYYSVRGERAKERPPDVGPNNLWWEDFAVPARYMRRLSHLLRGAGDPSGVAVLCTGDRLPFAVPAHLYRNQVGFCYLEEELLLDGSCRLADGRLVCAGQSYGLLLVEDGPELRPETRKVLPDLARQGLEVLEADPSDGTRWLDRAIAHAGLRCGTPAPGLRVRRVTRGGCTYLLCVNEGDDPVSTVLSLPSLRPFGAYDPWTGREEPVDVRPASGDAPGTRLALALGYRESRIIACAPMPATDAPDFVVATDALPLPSPSDSWLQALRQPLQLLFDDESSWRDLIRPIDWTDLRPDDFFSGSAEYTTGFVASDVLASSSCVLDLGRVEESAAVWLNGEKIGHRFWKPFRFDLTGRVRQGANHLRIVATNSISCRMDQVRKPSGVLGPLFLIGTPQASEKERA